MKSIFQNEYTHILLKMTHIIPKASRKQLTNNFKCKEAAFQHLPPLQDIEPTDLRPTGATQKMLHQYQYPHFFDYRVMEIK